MSVLSKMDFSESTGRMFSLWMPFDDCCISTTVFTFSSFSSLWVFWCRKLVSLIANFVIDSFQNSQKNMLGFHHRFEQNLSDIIETRTLFLQSDFMWKKMYFLLYIKSFPDAGTLAVLYHCSITRYAWFRAVSQLELSCVLYLYELIIYNFPEIFTLLLQKLMSCDRAMQMLCHLHCTPWREV